ncbi:CAP domain-containing protein [Oceanihabitans sediminis]|uniref:CAP domain-containing protein n=1 Tax=Oceanihabitans sediminis TaxID=1812012 RepID=A0A368P1T9_9FLAO|nr:CAP domain-containing protein [Oceanihabitans sediminis]RCU56498.1 CAP domain-containing protein [Oceanihabitans sediminis]
MKLTYCLFLVLLLSFSCSSDSEETNTESLTTDYVIPEAKQIEIDILKLINDYRIIEGLQTLDTLAIIKSQTYSHTEYMIKTNDVSHTNFPERKNFLNERAGAKKVSENLAFGYSSAESVVNGWINSDSHRGAIEGDYTHFEVSAEQDANGYWYFTNIFVKK